MLIFALAFVQLACAQHEGSRPSVLVAYRNGELHLPCKPVPDRKDADFKLTLHKENHHRPVCTASWTKNKTEIDPGQGGTYCDVQRSTNSVSFILTKLDRNHTGYYICQVEIFYPPPYRNQNSSKTYVYVHGKELTRCECGSLLPIWPLVGIAVVLLLCPVLLMTLCLRMRLRKSAPASHEPGSEYMAMAAVNAARKSQFKENDRIEKVTRSIQGNDRGAH